MPSQLDTGATTGNSLQTSTMSDDDRRSSTADDHTDTDKVTTRTPSAKRQGVRPIRGPSKEPPHLPPRVRSDFSTCPNIALINSQDKSVLAERFRSYVTASLSIRLNSIIQYENSDAKIFSIGTLPEVLLWGATSGGADDLSSYATFRGVPVKVWFPAEVKVPRFFDDKGKVLRKASLCFLPLRDLDYERANVILTTFSSPQVGTSTMFTSCSFYLHILLS